MAYRSGGLRFLRGCRGKHTPVFSPVPSSKFPADRHPGTATGSLGSKHLCDPANKRLFSSWVRPPTDDADEDGRSALRAVEKALAEYRQFESAPPWLPLIPGGSYWIPPQPSRFLPPPLTPPLTPVAWEEERASDVGVSSSEADSVTGSKDGKEPSASEADLERRLAAMWSSPGDRGDLYSHARGVNDADAASLLVALVKDGHQLVELEAFMALATDSFWPAWSHLLLPGVLSGVEGPLAHSSATAAPVRGQSMTKGRRKREVKAEQRQGPIETHKPRRGPRHEPGAAAGDRRWEREPARDVSGTSGALQASSSTTSLATAPAEVLVPPATAQESLEEGGVEGATPLACATKRTFQPSTRRKKRKHGFLARLKSVGGRRVLRRRLSKGRRRLAS